MKYRKLRLAWSAFWATATALLIVLWVRSYWHADFLCFQLGQTPTLGFVTIQGKLVTGCEPPGTAGTQFAINSSPLDAGILASFYVEPNRLGFGKSSLPGGTMCLIPLYAFAVVFPACVALPWVAHFRQFSLRTLLTITTLVAALLGLAVWSSQ